MVAGFLLPRLAPIAPEPANITNRLSHRSDNVKPRTQSRSLNPCCDRIHRTWKAAADFREAIRVKLDPAGAPLRLGVTLRRLGKPGQ